MKIKFIIPVTLTLLSCKGADSHKERTNASFVPNFELFRDNKGNNINTWASFHLFSSPVFYERVDLNGGDSISVKVNDQVELLKPAQNNYGVENFYKKVWPVEFENDVFTFIFKHNDVVLTKGVKLPNNFEITSTELADDFSSVHIKWTPVKDFEPKDVMSIYVDQTCPRQDNAETIGSVSLKPEQDNGEISLALKGFFVGCVHKLKMTRYRDSDLKPQYDHGSMKAYIFREKNI